MLGLDQETKKYLTNLLRNKEYSKLEAKISAMGNIDEQEPILIMYYASSKSLNPLSKIEDFIEASRLFEKVYLTKKKNHPLTLSDLEPLLNMIFLSFKTKIYQKTLSLALEAFKNNSQNEKLVEGLAIINSHLANNEKAIQYYKLLFQINNKRTVGRIPFLAYLNYASGIAQDYYLSECSKFSKIVEEDLIFEESKIILNKNKKIKVAFLSSDLKKHPVSFFLKDLFFNIDKKIIEIIALSNLDKNKEDEISETLKNTVNQWHNISDKSDVEVINLIKFLDIDILIDLNGLTKGNRIHVMKNRCAPIQICWLGYNNSTGLKNIDYLIADHNLIKKNEENLYSEKILYLPKTWIVHSQPMELPPVNFSIKKNDLLFTYGSFNNFKKISDDTIEVWAKIIKNSNSKIYLKNSQGNACLDLKENILKKFTDRGVPKNKITILDTEKNTYNHLNIYNKIDLVLDTFPFPGVTTSFEAVLMGVPVLTMKGFNFNSRCGESINTNLQMENFIAKDKNDYFEKAISFQNSPNDLKKIKLNLRNKVLSSPLFDTKNFTKNFTEILKEVHLKHVSIDKD